MTTILLTKMDFNLFNGDLLLHETQNVFFFFLQIFCFIFLYAKIMQIWIVNYVCHATRANVLAHEAGKCYFSLPPFLVFGPRRFHKSIVQLFQEVEVDVKARTKGEMGACKSLCSPFDQPELPEGSLYVSCQGYLIYCISITTFKP